MRCLCFCHALWLPIRSTACSRELRGVRGTASAKPLHSDSTAVPSCKCQANVSQRKGLATLCCSNATNWLLISHLRSAWHEPSSASRLRGTTPVEPWQVARRQGARCLVSMHQYAASVRGRLQTCISRCRVRVGSPCRCPPFQGARQGTMTIPSYPTAPAQNNCLLQNR